MDLYQRFIALKSYARYLPDQRRRETWPESVGRLGKFWHGRFPDLFPLEEVLWAVENLDVMPSMRSLMTAGPALDRDEAAAFNCSYLAIDHPWSFDEALYLLACGCGVGFSVERQIITKLPQVAADMKQINHVIVVGDSKEGWASALRELIHLLYGGLVPRWDVAGVRPRGTPLKTFGGRSSGPGPLVALFKFVVQTFIGARGRKLESLECHDLMCEIGRCIVSGGVRRSALISLSNLSDLRMREAKFGAFHERRHKANNSVAYDGRPELEVFIDEWRSLYTSKMGERGIFNRGGAQAKALTLDPPRTLPDDCGTNPCGEIVLRNMGFCNLTEAVVRANDDLALLKVKVRLAAVLGTFQATLTSFKYLRPAWTHNAQEERLLGVSLTGMMDHPVLSTTSNEAALWLVELRGVAVATNREWAAKLGIPAAAAVTCVKPSGTVSQLVDCASGLHPRHASHYVRTVRVAQADPLAVWLQQQGVPNEPDVYTETDVVFSFPKAAPAGARTGADLTAIQQLDHWLMVASCWTEHNPSITVSVREHEWLEVAAWLWKHWDAANGLAFLPHDDHGYEQAPYQTIDEATYVKLRDGFPDVDLSAYAVDEAIDHSTGSQELACVGNLCEIP